MEKFKPDEQKGESINTQISPEQAREIEWFSSNTEYGDKVTREGKTIFGLSLTANPDYAQSYSKTKKINVFRLPNATLKPVSFDYGMTIDEEKKNEIIAEGFDGILFDGMGGPEVAMLTNAAQLEGVRIPIPGGIQALIESRKSLPESVVRDYEINLPEGYKLNNGRYVFES